MVMVSMKIQTVQTILLSAVYRLALFSISPCHFTGVMGLLDLHLRNKGLLSLMCLTWRKLNGDAECRRRDHKEDEIIH